jgi:hypothetical protein
MIFRSFLLAYTLHILLLWVFVGQAHVKNRRGRQQQQRHTAELLLATCRRGDLSGKRRSISDAVFGVYSHYRTRMDKNGLSHFFCSENSGMNQTWKKCPWNCSSMFS